VRQKKLTDLPINELVASDLRRKEVTNQYSHGCVDKTIKETSQFGLLVRGIGVENEAVINQWESQHNDQCIEPVVIAMGENHQLENELKGK
jgi:hypothetical protein